MQQLITVLHVLAAISMVSLILLQHGKGADMGASFGSGASNTMFGSSGSIPFLMKLTATLGVLFFATSLSLSYIAGHAKKQASSFDLMNVQPMNVTTPKPKQKIKVLPAVPNNKKTESQSE